MSNAGYTVGWVLWIVAFFCLELPALASKVPGKTLSEHVWDWFRVRDSRHTALTWALRGFLLVLLFWLFFHLGFGWFTPTHPLPGR
jgi:hypothetical protein